MEQRYLHLQCKTIFKRFALSPQLSPEIRRANYSSGRNQLVNNLTITTQVDILGLPFNILYKEFSYSFKDFLSMVMISLNPSLNAARSTNLAPPLKNMFPSIFYDTQKIS